MPITNKLGNRSVNVITAENSRLLLNHSSNTANSGTIQTIQVAGSSAGDSFVRYGIASGQQWVEGIDNSDSDAYVISSNSIPGTNNALHITTGGLVNKPLTANFSSAQSSGVGNATGDGTTYTLGGSGVTEAYDIGGDFDPSTGQFVAPIDGIYLFNVAWGFDDISTSGATTGVAEIGVNSNNYYWWVCGPSSIDNVSQIIFCSGSMIIKLTAGDVVVSKVTMSNGTKTVDITLGQTKFAGMLIA